MKLINSTFCQFVVRPFVRRTFCMCTDSDDLAMMAMMFWQWCSDSDDGDTVMMMTMTIWIWGSDNCNDDDDAMTVVMKMMLL